MPTAPSGVVVRAGLYLGTTSRWRGSTGTAQGAPRYTSAHPWQGLSLWVGHRSQVGLR